MQQMSDNLARDKLNLLTNLQFLFVTGKGGVGKSTTAALLGLHASKRGKRALVVVPQTSHNTPSLFGRELSTTPTTVTGSLSAVRISPGEAMREYCRQVLHSQTLTNALFHRSVAGGFLAGIPGLNDWALLGKSWAWTRSGTFDLPPGQTPFDLVIFDAPASGDGTKMLKVPQVILDLSPQGRLRDDAATCLTMLRDPNRSSTLVVSLAEDFAVTETEENLDFLQNELALPVGPLVLNRMLNARVDETDLVPLEQARARLQTQPDSEKQPGPLRVVEAALRHAKRQKEQARQRQRLLSAGRDVIEVPEMNDDLSSLSDLTALWQHISGDGRQEGAKLG